MSRYFYRRYALPTLAQQVALEIIFNKQPNGATINELRNAGVRLTTLKAMYRRQWLVHPSDHLWKISLQGEYVLNMVRK